MLSELQSVGLHMTSNYIKFVSRKKKSHEVQAYVIIIWLFFLFRIKF